MAKVDIVVNGRSFAVGCEPGEEEHLKSLARHFDSHVSRLAERVGQIGDLRLFLMAALVVSDELSDAARENEALRGKARGDGDGNAAAEALIKAAERIEALADRAEKTP